MKNNEGEKGDFSENQGQIRRSADWCMAGRKGEASRPKGSYRRQVSRLVRGPPEGGRACAEEID
jgi:hypothetical protein